MDVTSKDQLLADVNTLARALRAMPASPAVEKAVYHSERLDLAIRTSHTEGMRFAAFTVSKIVRDLGVQAPPAVGDALARIRAALQASGLELQK